MAELVRDMAMRRDSSRWKERGSALLSLLLSLTLISLLAGMALPSVLHMYQQAMLEREAEVLLANLRYVQQLDRMTSVDDDNFPYIAFQADGYRLYSYQYSSGQWQCLLVHRTPSGVSFRLGFAPSNETGFPSRRFYFYRNGKLPSIGGSIWLYYQGRGQLVRRLLVTHDGRCRLGRQDETESQR